MSGIRMVVTQQRRQWRRRESAWRMIDTYVLIYRGGPIPLGRPHRMPSSSGGSASHASVGRLLMVRRRYDGMQDIV